MNKSFLESYNTDVAILSNNAITFSANALTKGCAIKQTGATTFALNERGLYRVIASVSGAVTTTAGNIEIAVRRDGLVLDKSIQQGYSGTALTDDVNIVVDTFVQSDKDYNGSCCSSPVIVEIVLTSASQNATFENVHVSIEKVCGV